MEPEEGEVLKTTTGAILGTPTYMSPEQCRGVGAVTDKSDVYSLGCMLYQMLGGRTPFVGSGSGDLIAMHIMEQPQPLHELAPNVSADVETLVHQMLEKKPAVRPSMKQVLASLEQLGLSSTASGYGQVVIVAPPPSVSRPEEPRKKSALPIVMGLIAVVAVGGGAAVVLSQKNQAPVNPQPPIGAGQNPLVSPINPPMNATKPSAVKLEVQSDPPGAQVLSAVDQRPLGTTPWKLERPIVEGKLEVVVRLPGFFDQKLVFDGTHDDSRPIKLAAAPPVVPGVKKPIFFRKPLQKPVGKPSSPGTKKPDDDLDVPVVR
jgi:serine/threonine protein kinase